MKKLTKKTKTSKNECIDHLKKSVNDIKFAWLLARRAGKFNMSYLKTKLVMGDSLCKTGKPTR